MPSGRCSSRFVLVTAVMLEVAAAASAESPARTHDITVDDYFTQSYVAEIAISPDGERVAYIEGRWDETLDRRNMDLWVVGVADREPTRLTFSPATERRPQWSADGRAVYVLANRNEGPDRAAPHDGSLQVWRHDVAGGAPFAVTRVEDGVEQYRISHDGDTLYYVVGEEQVDEDRWQKLREEFGDLEYGHGVVEFGELWALDLRTWRARRLVDESRVIVDFVVAPDESRIAMITTPTGELISNEGWSEVDVYDAATGDVMRLGSRLWRDAAPSPYGWIIEPCWSSDGTKLAFRVDFDGFPGEVFVVHYGGGDPVITTIDRPDEVHVEGGMAWWPERHDLCFVADDHARRRVYRVMDVGPVGHGTAEALTPGDVVVDAFSADRRGDAMAVIKGGLTHTPDVFMVERRDGAVAYDRLTNINPQVATWKMPSIQIVRWTAPDGTEVEGILELPPGYGGAEPLPTLVTIHGGPTSSSKLAFRYWIYGRGIYAARGWAVFDPNYRGSTGYGDAFLTDLIENKNRLDVQDILAGVDMLVEQGIADPERLAVTGWSNGGYLTNCLITTTDRFKAASSGAGVFDTVMQWSIEDTPGHVINYSGGLPWERAEKMHETSPLYNVGDVVTPTLVHVGENDPRTPPEHSRGLHRALHHYVGVPCELVVYPETGHGLRKLSHRRAKLEWDLAWIEHYVLGHSAEEEKGEDDGE